MQKLDRGTELAVLDLEGNRLRGHFGEADDDSIQLRDGALTNRINRAEVLEIATIGPGKGSPSAAAGFAMAGALAAFLIDARLAFSPIQKAGAADHLPRAVNRISSWGAQDPRRAESPA